VPIVGGKLGPREIESALRILTQAGAVVGSETSMSLVSIRLLATPERIRREISGDANLELGLLRALWRMVGDQLNTGATIDLDGLPPGLSGRSGASSLLDSLQSRQFLVWERLGGGLRLSAPDAPLSRFRVDWASIDRRRNAELSKLEAVQKYAYTKWCRRGFVLKYFGDPAARTKCEGCDNCLGVAREREPAKSRDRGLAKPQRGSRSRLARKPGTSTNVSAGDEIVLSATDERLLASLKEKRREIAREDSVPPYIVFSDRTLADIALRRPASLEALAGVRGVGEMKLAKYGEKFLAVVRGSDETEAA